MDEAYLEPEMDGHLRNLLNSARELLYRGLVKSREISPGSTWEQISKHLRTVLDKTHHLVNAPSNVYMNIADFK